MCSFLVYKGSKDRFNHDVNRFLKPRGPDLTTVTEINGYTFVHNLLSITGECTPQPFIDGDVVCVYNGQIYNFRSFAEQSRSRTFRSDGECLIPLYKEYGSEFIKKLDGEFAICLIDFKKQIAVVSKDVFGTKPLYVTDIQESDFACSTYVDPLNKLGFEPYPAPPNKYQVIPLNGGHEEYFDIREWDLEQNIDSFEPWNIAFSESIRKRTQTDKGIFVGLSSGYDSQVIVHQLLKQNVSFETFSVIGDENYQVLEERWKLLKKTPVIIPKNEANYNAARMHNFHYVAPYQYNISSDLTGYKEHTMLYDDSGSIWQSAVCSEAIKKGCKILLSGSGADEIISDYSKYPHTNFRGIFPEDLKSIFPWRSFYHSTMESYLMKDESVSGSYGIEGRYPYLDVQTVQCFLNLTAKLKNSKYKSVIAEYLERNNQPYEANTKRGF